MPALTIQNIRTMNQDHANATFFHPFDDALALVMDCTASSDLLSLPGPMFHAQFEIINPSTDTVVINKRLVARASSSPEQRTRPRRRGSATRQGGECSCFSKPMTSSETTPLSFLEECDLFARHPTSRTVLWPSSRTCTEVYGT